MQSRAVILLYHRIVDDAPDLLDYSPSGMTLRRSAFEQQMRYLRAHYDVIPLSELVAQLSGSGAVGNARCAVTFDDGWRDNYTHAFPILRSLGIPATIFVATNYINGGTWFWEERLKYVIAHVVQRARDGVLTAARRDELRQALIGMFGRDPLPMRLAVLRSFLTRQVNALRQHPEQDRERVMAGLETLLQWPELIETRRFLSWAEIHEMEQYGVEFAAHTISHVNLERTEADDARREISGSWSAIESRLARAAPLFAYPFGKHSNATRQIVVDAGLSGAVTTENGFISSTSDRWRLNRIDIHETCAATIPTFACTIMRFVSPH
jgi:peptidoglycan/xylan/chitin deacetylase (PgdA/CDA1 family)